MPSGTAVSASLHRRIDLAGRVVGMRAQDMPEPSDHSRPAGVNMPVPVSMIRAAVPRLLIAHDAQDARRTRLQHINNNHPDATAKHWQTPGPGAPAYGRITCKRGSDRSSVGCRPAETRRVPLICGGFRDVFGVIKVWSALNRPSRPFG